MDTQQTAAAIGEVVAGYFRLWNETDATYRDPLLAAEGYDALDAVIGAVHAQYPGHRFRLTGAIDAYPGRARWNWALAGLDVAVLDDDGRLRSVTGFFEVAVGAV